MFLFSDFVTDPQVKLVFGIIALILVNIDIVWVTLAWAKGKVMEMILAIKKYCILIPKQKKYKKEKLRLESEK